MSRETWLTIFLCIVAGFLLPPLVMILISWVQLIALLFGTVL